MTAVDGPVPDSPDFDADLRACVETILGVPPPLPGEDGDALTVLKQWLAERNLGLVPIAGARDFAWPGAWLARVRIDHTDHAVVMFGSPSGAMHDPHGALARGGTIAEGWLLARLDLRLPIEEPYGRNASTGSVAALLIAPDAEEPLVRVDSVDAVAGRGLAGDRYHDGRGTFGGPGRGFELTLVEAEALDEADLAWEQARRNVVTRGISLNALVGRPFRIGPVECVGRRLAEPCAHLEKLTRPGIMRPLVHRAGLRADIVTGGPIAVGDPISASDES
jgi:MOSC domain-containing protein YiiM